MLSTNRRRSVTSKTSTFPNSLHRPDKWKLPHSTGDRSRWTNLHLQPGLLFGAAIKSAFTVGTLPAGPLGPSWHTTGLYPQPPSVRSSSVAHPASVDPLPTKSASLALRFNHLSVGWLRLLCKCLCKHSLSVSHSTGPVSGHCVPIEQPLCKEGTAVCVLWSGRLDSCIPVLSNWSLPICI